MRSDTVVWLAAPVCVCVSCFHVSEASAEISLWTAQLGLHLWHTGTHLCLRTRLLWHACLFLLNETLKKACRKTGLCQHSGDYRRSHASISSLIFPNLSKTTVVFTFPYKWMFFRLLLENMQPVLTALFYNIMTCQRSVVTVTVRTIKVSRSHGEGSAVAYTITLFQNPLLHVMTPGAIKT